MKLRATGYVFGVLVIVALLAMAVAWGPWETRASVCEYCGCPHSQKWRLGIKIRDRIDDSSVTQWVLQYYPNHTQHMWRYASSEKFSVDIHLPLFHNFHFSRGESSDGRGGGVNLLYEIWIQRSTLGEEKAHALLGRYHALLASGNAKQIHDAVQAHFTKGVPLETLLPPAAP